MFLDDWQGYQLQPNPVDLQARTVLPGRVGIAGRLLSRESGLAIYREPFFQDTKVVERPAATRRR